MGALSLFHASEVLHCKLALGVASTFHDMLVNSSLGHSALTLSEIYLSVDGKGFKHFLVITFHGRSEPNSLTAYRSTAV
jgi:hypothetical protein